MFEMDKDVRFEKKNVKKILFKSNSTNFHSDLHLKKKLLSYIESLLILARIVRRQII